MYPVLPSQDRGSLSPLSLGIKSEIIPRGVRLTLLMSEHGSPWAVAEVARPLGTRSPEVLFSCSSADAVPADQVLRFGEGLIVLVHAARSWEHYLLSCCGFCLLGTHRKCESQRCGCAAGRHEPPFPSWGGA